MTTTQDDTIVAVPNHKTRLRVFAEELLVDILVTAAIVWAIVVLGEPLSHVLTSPLFIILSVGGLAHLTAKSLRHKQPAIVADPT